MSEKPKNRKIIWRQRIGKVFSVLIGAACGHLLASYMDTAFARDLPLRKEILSYFGAALLILPAILVQIIIHEAGHLLFGRMSGYTFSAFRLMRCMWVKENGKIRFRRSHHDGTIGRCLMAPPEMKDGRIPVAMYNLGGVVTNILAGLAFLWLFVRTAATPPLSATLLLFATLGFIYALINGIPMRLDDVDNEGYNAFALGKNRDTMRALWVRLKTNEQMLNGVRLKDMPEDWFAVPADDGIKNSLLAAMGVLACNRLMDEHRFVAAKRLMARLLDVDGGIVGLLRVLMICDRLFIELIGENRRDVVEAMLTKEQKKFMKSMKRFPTVLRVQYAYALLFEKDESAAKEVEAQFDKCAKSYPHPSEIQAERELMEIAKNKASA